MVCCKCRLEMTCAKNEVGALFGKAHVYAADRFKCPECGVTILKTNATPYYDPYLNMQDEYLEMATKPVEV